MKKHRYYSHPNLFQGLAITLIVITIAIPFCVLTGCDFYFGSKIVQILNEGDDVRDGE